MHYGLNDKFETRVKHNFKLCVLLTSKSFHWKQDDIMDSIYRLHGYRSHKTVKYGKNSSHIHVKFTEEYMAKEAVEFLNNLNTDLTAVLVDDMLRDWFNHEKKSNLKPPCTLTIVDITGSPPLGLNFLTEYVINSIFRNFGNPYLLPYTAALKEPHAQLLFGSMTEALAACMAFGEWYVKDRKLDSFYYRVRINPSENEAMLIRKSGGTPKEAFKLDYFLNVRNEVIQNQKINEQDSAPKVPCNKISQNKGAQKSRKQKRAPTVDTEHNQNSLALEMAHRTPIICVPIIAPFNSYAQALMATNRRINADFTNILNVQQTSAVSTKVTVGAVDSEIDGNSSMQSAGAEGLDCNDVGSLEEVSEQPGCTDTFAEKPDLIPSRPIRGETVKQRRNIQKGHPSMYERRK